MRRNLVDLCKKFCYNKIKKGEIKMYLPLNFYRKMDSSGRYVIPAQIRKDFNVSTGDEVGLCLIKDGERYFLGFEVKPTEDYLENLKKFSAIL